MSSILISAYGDDAFQAGHATPPVVPVDWASCSARPNDCCLRSMGQYEANFVFSIINEVSFMVKRTTRPETSGYGKQHKEKDRRASAKRSNHALNDAGTAG